jgi:hypothetical protein
MIIRTVFLAFGLTVLPAPVLAGAPPLAEPARAAEPATVHASSDVLGSPVDDGSLQTQRGGDSYVIADQDMVAITANNTINGDYSAGPVTLSDNAFANFNGIGNVMINTGGQVSLQSGMNVTINVGE